MRKIKDIKTGKAYQKKLAERIEYFEGFDKRVLEDIAKGKVENADEIAVEAAKVLLNRGLPPPMNTINI